MGNITVVIPNGNKLSPERKAQLINDLETNPVRKLTKEEREIYSEAVAKATLLIPAFRSAIALMRPYMDASSSTAYTDRYARVAFSYWFFYVIDQQTRAGVLLHECMHVLNNHFARREEIKSMRANPALFNIAGDFEINTTLERVPFVNLNDGQFPDRAPHSYPPRKTMELYADLLYKDQKKREEECPVHGTDAKKNQDKNKQNSEKDSSDKNKENSSKSENSDSEQDNEQNSGDSGQDAQSDSENSESEEQGDSNEGSGSGEAEAKCSCGKSDSQSNSRGQGQDQGQGQGSGQGSGQGQGQGNGSGNGDDSGKSSGDGEWACGNSDEKTETAADEAGIQRASDVEQTVAKRNTAARLMEEREKQNRGGRGTSYSDAWFEAILQHLIPPVVDWRKIFRRIIASTTDSLAKGRSDYTYRRTSRRLQDAKFIYPGMVTYNPKVMMGVDTSGSMGGDDYRALLNEVESMLKEIARGKEPVTLFAVDTKIGNIQPVTSVRKINLNGGGGTIMAVAWQHVNALPARQRPDVFVLATDGYIDWDDVEREVRQSRFKSIILVTQEGGFASCPDSLKKIIPVLDISLKNKK